MKWITDDGKEIYLLTLEQFNQIPDGIELVSILSERKIKGVDYIDDDTRMGVLAFGIEMPLETHPAAEVLTKLRLQGQI